MRMLRRLSLVLVVGVTSAMAAQGGQSSDGPGVPAGPMGTVPTTRVLATGHLTSATPPDPQAMRTVMPSEVKATVALYLNGKLDQWFVRQDGKGVVFLLNAQSVEEAQALLSKLPLVQAKRLEFDLMPLGPLSPLRYLMGDGASAAAH